MKSYLLTVGLVILLCPAKILAQKINSPVASNQFDKDWLQQAGKIISEREYYFKASDRSAFELYAANRKQKIGFTFKGSGYTVAPINFTGNADNWKVDFDLIGLSRGQNKILPG